MKNKIILIFLFSLLTPIHFVLGSYNSWAPLGSPANPVNIQSGGSVDGYNPWAPLGSPANPVNVQYNGNSSAANSHVPIAPQPATWNDLSNQVSDQACKKVSGINSIYTGETDVSKGGGNGGCGCKPGFEFDHGNYGECITVVQEKTKSMNSGNKVTSSFPPTTKEADSIINKFKIVNGQVKIKEIATTSSQNKPIVSTSLNNQVPTSTKNTEQKGWWAKMISWFGF